MTLAVNTTNELAYELNVSPRTSLDSHCTTTDLKPETPAAAPLAPVQPTLTPSLRLLFSLVSRKHLVCLILPAIFSSVIAGGIAPFMTFVVGQAFDTFAQFPLTANPPQSAKDALLRGVGEGDVKGLDPARPPHPQIVRDLLEPPHIASGETNNGPFAGI